MSDLTVKNWIPAWLADLEQTSGEPERNFETGACELAEVACKAQLVRSDGSVENGLKRIGTRSFEKWVDAVEIVLERENPERE